MKYPIRYIEGKSNSQEVASVPKNRTGRSIESLIKTTYFIENIKQYANNEKFSLDYCLHQEKKLGATYLYNKNQGIKYLENISWLSVYDKDNIIHKRTIENYLESDKNRKIGREKRLHKGTKGALYSEGTSLDSKIESIPIINENVNTTQIEKDIKKLSMDTILNSNIYIKKIVKKSHNNNPDKKTTLVDIQIFDLQNKQNINATIEKILKVCYVYRKIITGDIVFRITINALSKVGKEKFENVLFEKNQNGEYYYIAKLKSYHRATGARESIYSTELGLKDSNIGITVKVPDIANYIGYDV